MRITIKQTRSPGAAGCAAMAALILVSSVAAAGEDCERISGDANMTMLGPMGPTVGTVEFVIGGQAYVATVTNTLLEAPRVTDDGTIHSLTMNRYDFTDGSTLTGIVRAVHSPTETPGVYRNNARLSYAGGSGIYRNAYGRFSGHGYQSFIDMTSTMSGKGIVCGRGEIGD